MLPILVQEQKGGKTARQLFGTVSERTEAIITKPVEQKRIRSILDVVRQYVAYFRYFLD